MFDIYQQQSKVTYCMQAYHDNTPCNSSLQRQCLHGMSHPSEQGRILIVPHCTPMLYSLAHCMILGNDTLSLQALLPYTRAELIQTSQQSLPASVVFHHHPGLVQ